MARARLHLNFCCELYQLQLDGGRHFIHEHPARATSWSETCVKKLLRRSDVHLAHADACQYGMEGIWQGQTLPIRKCTGWMTSMKAVAASMSRQCSGKYGLCSSGLPHASCTGTRANNAAIYPLKTCRALLDGIARELRQQGHLHLNCVGIQWPSDHEDENVAAHRPVDNLTATQGHFQTVESLLAPHLWAHFSADSPH